MQVHQIWDQLESWFRDQKEFVPISAVLDKCAAISPSPICKFCCCISSNELKTPSTHAYLVLTGGQLMEEWASVFGTRATRYDVKRLRKLLVKEHNRPPTEEESDTIVDKCRSAFYLHVIQGLCHRGRSVTQQMFHLTMLWRHKGISRTGSDILASMSLAMPHTTFDLQMQYKVHDSQEEFK